MKDVAQLALTRAVIIDDSFGLEMSSQRALVLVRAKVLDTLGWLHQDIVRMIFGCSFECGTDTLTAFCALSAIDAEKWDTIRLKRVYLLLLDLLL